MGAELGPLEIGMAPGLWPGLLRYRDDSKRFCTTTRSVSSMIVAALSNATLATHSHVYLAFFSLQLAFYAAAAGGGWMGVRILQIPSFLVLANVAVLTAWFRYARGERITRWDPSDRLAVLPQPSAR